jgi:hypothetical protein
VTIATLTDVAAINIAGPSIVYMYRNQSLSLFASGTSSCGDILPTLNYTWTISQGGIITSFTSSSLDKRYLNLNAYTLNPSTIYVAQVSISSSPTQILTSQVLVQVGLGGINAIIAGGSTQSIYYKNTLTLDASSSYSYDYPSDLSQITFSWSCIDRTPATYGGKCTGVSTTTTLSKLVQSLLLFKSTKIYAFTVTVADKRGQTAAYTVAVITTV